MEKQSSGERKPHTAAAVSAKAMKGSERSALEAKILREEAAKLERPLEIETVWGGDKNGSGDNVGLYKVDAQAIKDAQRAGELRRAAKALAERSKSQAEKESEPTKMIQRPREKESFTFWGKVKNMFGK